MNNALTIELDWFPSRGNWPYGRAIEGWVLRRPFFPSLRRAVAWPLATCLFVPRLEFDDEPLRQWLERHHG